MIRCRLSGGYLEVSDKLCSRVSRYKNKLSAICVMVRNSPEISAKPDKNQ